MSFENPLVGFQHAFESNFHGMNYICANGDRSNLALKYQPAVCYSDKSLSKAEIAQVRKVVMNAGGAAGMVNGIEFFDADGKKLM